MAWAGTTGTYTEFIARHGITFPTIDDTPGDLFSALQVPGQPAFAFVKGDSVDRAFGSLTESEFASRVATLVAG